MKPSKKVTAGTLAASLTTLIISLTNWPVDPAAAAALTTIIGFGLSYLIPD